ncbi:unnamed protein product, partial [Prunus brigantina]
VNHNTIETLTGSNYLKWKQDLEISLGFLDYDFVLKEDPPQEPATDASTETKTKFAKWNKANKMAILIMQRAMASSVKGSVPKSDIAKKYYESIAQRFKESEKAVKSTLLNKLIDMKYDGQGCVRAHIMNMIDIGTKLQELEMTVDEDMMVHFALNSLPKEFKSLRETYIAQKESWNLNDLITISVQQEHNIIRERGAKMVNMVQVKEKKESKKNTMIEKGKSSNTENGASIHVSNSLQGFIRRRLPRKDEVKVFVGNGEKVQVEFIGTVRIELEFGFVLELDEVVYIPSMKKSLISVTRLVQSKFNLIFDGTGCSIFKNKELIGKARLVDGMFQLNCKGTVFEANTVQTKTSIDVSYKLWHKRLGHISRERINQLCKESILPPLNHDSQKEICIECVKGKLTNLRKKGAIGSKGVLEIIHTDICGPFPNPTHDGFTYFITFTDDFSRFGHVYLIKEKSSALDMFKIYKAEVENQLNLKIKVVRSDRGGEYYGRFDETGRNPGAFAKFLQQEGIIAQYTNPGTPQQNGISERRNRTLKDMIRSMMTEAKPYNPAEKKLDPKTISCHFIGYPERTKGYRFYCPHHTMRFIETSRAIFIETDEEKTVEETFIFEEITADTMKSELNSMEKNGVWELVTLPQSCKPIGCKWVFKTKRNSKGQVDRYKARLVAKGFTQKEGIDYNETFSPVSTKDSLRIIMALVAHFDLHLHQMDVKTAFLNGDLEEEIYMMQPEGFIQEKEKNLDCAGSDVPIAKSDKLSTEQAPKTEQEKLEMADKPYASLVGSLMYAQVCTRPDLAFAVSMLGRFQSNPGQAHWVAGKKVMRYLQRTKDYKLVFKKSESLELKGFADADFAGCQDTLKSTSGFVFMFGGAAVSWRSIKQPLTAGSTMLAEFLA